MKKSIISKLSSLIDESGSIDKINTYEDVLIESIEEIISEESFYELPTNEILKIIEKSDIQDTKLINLLSTKMNKHKGKASILLLNVIDPKDAVFDDCIEIISKFNKCPFCKRIGKLYEENKNLPYRDYEHEILELKQQNEKLKKTTMFPPVTEEPYDFERSLVKAAEKGKLSSVQYLVEKYHISVETSNYRNQTPIGIAAEKGNLFMIKYLYEYCHANAEAKDSDGYTPIYYASEKGYLDVAKYLFEICHVNVESKGKYGWNPLIVACYKGNFEIIMYLCETCHANIETENRDGRTPISFAAEFGYLEIVKYLFDNCHASANATGNAAQLDCILPHVVII